MAMSSMLQQRHCLVWKTKAPSHDRPRESPAFFWMNSDWYLGIYHHRVHSLYTINLISHIARELLPAISVTVFLEDRKKSNEPILCQKILNFEHCITTIWAEPAVSISEKMPGFELDQEFTIVCVFETNIPSGLLVIKDGKGRKRKYVSLDASSPSQSTSSADDISYLSQSSFSTSECPLIKLESLSQDFSNLIEKNITPDVQLRSGDCTLTAHKVVLSARSEVFRAMFEHKLAERKSGVVNIKDIDPPVLSVFLKYLYSGKITEKLSDDMIGKLYSVGDKYSVSSLSKLCSDFMAKCLREDNYLQILALADTHSDEKLKKAVVKFVMKNNVLLTSENWITFSEKQPRLANEIYRVFAKSVLK